MMIIMFEAVRESACVCVRVCASIFVYVRLKCACLRGLRSAEVGCSTWAAALFAEC